MKVENKNPQSYEDVKVFAGDDYYSAPAASYKNLIWESKGIQTTFNFRTFASFFTSRLYMKIFTA